MPNITETHEHIARLTARDERCSVFAPSFGVFRIEDATHEPNTWLSMAQLAGEKVHANRSRLVRWFDPSLYQATEASQHLLSDVRRALAEHEFTFYLQPQCRLDTGKVVGFEALARWDHPTHGIIPPLHYVGMLERCGLIRELDLYIWEAVCAQLAAWNAEGIRTLPISINVSTLDLYEIDVPATLSELCERYEIDPSLIVIEITESAYVENFDKIAEVTTQLHAAGFRVAMDDFGSGYSSLAMLKNIDVDSVKVDMQFLRLDKSNIERGTNILAFIIRLVNVLKIDILAEGVEEDYQVDLLLSMGCRLAQGFHYYRPMTIAKAHNLLLRDDLIAQADDIESDYGRFGISDLVGKGIISDRLLEKLLGPTAICEVGPDGLKVLNVNPEGLALLHLDPQEVRLEQESTINHFLGGDLGMLSAAFEDAYQNRPHRTRITLKGTRRCGVGLWLAVRICFLQERGDWRMFCLAMNDVTPIDPRYLQGSSPAVRVAQTLEGADPADQILLDLVHIISTGEYGRAFNRFLERMGKHYGATRCYIFELDRDTGTCSNTYEWCDEGVSAEIGNLQNLPIELVADWIAAFESVSEFYISSISGDDDPDSPTNRILAAQGIDSLITAPLRENGRIIGFVGVDDPTRNVHDFSALRVAAEFVSECNKMSTLTTRSYIDPLTGLGNRRAYMRMIDLVDTGQPSSMGIAFVDLNGLKRINDAAGHRAGDAALVHMADALCDIAGRDNVYRFGGDEFIVALPGCTRERYDEVVTRLREDLGPVSSMGCTWQEFCTNPLLLVEKADALMYEEKRRFYESLQNAVE